MPKYKKSPTIHATPFLQRTSRLPTPRRLKVLTLLLVTLCFYLFYRSSGSPADSADLSGNFYDRTKSALDHKSKPDLADHGSREHVSLSDKDKADTDEDLAESKKTVERLKKAAQVAKDNANAKAPKPDPPSSVIGVGSAAMGKKDKEKSGKEKEKNPGNLGVAGAGGTGRRKSDEEKGAKLETEEDHEVEMELNLILKKSTIIIFSKSYCPHSRDAKNILLEKYIIDPPPYVVELDKHPLGLNLQARLQELTGRGTVPNILINGVSIGGGDDLIELDQAKKLVEKIKEIGGKKILDARPRAGSNREREKEKEKAKVGLVHGSDSAV